MIISSCEVTFHRTAFFIHNTQHYTNHGPSGKVDGGQVINGFLAQVHFTVGLVGPGTNPGVMSPVPECVIKIDNPWKLAEQPHNPCRFLGL